jgi:hypothetical protein
MREETVVRSSDLATGWVVISVNHFFNKREHGYIVPMLL